MPRSTSRMIWTIPAEGDDPYFDFFQAFAGELDAAGFAFSDNDNLIITGGALFTWDLASSTLVWDGPFYLSGFTSGFSARVPGPTGTAPTLANGGAGAVNAGKHYYFVTFFDGATETAAGPAASILLATPSTVNISAIPIGPLGTTQRRIYRTDASGFTLKLLVTIPNNVTTAYVDSTADGSLGAPLALTPVSQITILEGQVMAVDMPRLLQADVDVTPFAAARVAESNGVKIHDKVVIAVRRNGVIYFRNGVALEDGGSGPVWERPAPAGSTGMTSTQRAAINAALHTHVEYQFNQPGTPIGTTLLVLPDQSPEVVQRVDVFRNGNRVTLGIDYSVSLANPNPTVTLNIPTILNDQYLVVAQISKTVP